MRGRVRRAWVAVAVMCVLAATGSGGCATREEPKDGTAEWSLPTSETPEPSDTVPPADLALPLTDDAGREPADAFADYIAAVATGDPERVWATYGGTPPADYSVWAAEWEDAAEVYESSAVLEQRVVEEELALVRVVYRVRSGDDLVEVVAPGEWWRIVKANGLWKVAWLPRQ